MWVRKQWDRVGAVAAAAGGLLAAIIGWYGASDETNPAGQIPYVISGGIMGVLLLGIAATLWLSADLRDEWRKLDRLEHQLAARDGAAPATSSAPVAPPAEARVQTTGRADHATRPIRRATT